MNILDKIVAHKQLEVEELKKTVPVSVLERGAGFEREVVSMKQHVADPTKSGIIAEFKRRSPSKGLINGSSEVEQTTMGYVNAGASGLSVLTDQEFFGGANEDLVSARKVNSAPILRKDFVIDEYQIVEAKSIGADCILLIAAVLDPARLEELAGFAHRLGLEVLLEVHDEAELSRSINDNVDLIGVNNRSLKTFEVSLDISLHLVDKIPSSFVRISESGISDPKTLVQLRAAGFDGFLIGENFMKSDNPMEAAARFIDDFRKLGAGLEY